MISKHLDIYLHLERAMVAIEPLDELISDRLRDLMDPVWFELTEQDRAWLNQRVHARGRHHGRKLES